MLTTIAIAASLAGLAPQVRADMECMAVFSMMVGTKEKVSAEQLTGLVGATMYYYGRIEGTMPGVEINGLIIELAKAPEFLDSVPAHGQRCGNEMVARGQALSAMGREMVEAAKQGASPSK